MNAYREWIIRQEYHKLLAQKAIVNTFKPRNDINVSKLYEWCHAFWVNYNLDTFMPADFRTLSQYKQFVKQLGGTL